MSLTVERPPNQRHQNTFIEWDTVRGRGDFDAGYVNEFSLYNENGEIDEQKKKQFDEDPQYKNVRIHKTSSLGHKRPKNIAKKSTNSDGQVNKKIKKVRTMKLPQQDKK